MTADILHASESYLPDTLAIITDSHYSKMSNTTLVLLENFDFFDFPYLRNAKHARNGHNLWSSSRITLAMYQSTQSSPELCFILPTGRYWKKISRNSLEKKNSKPVNHPSQDLT